MTITVVASSAIGVTNGSTIVLSFGTVQADDVAIVATAMCRTGGGGVTSSAGTAYTQIGTNQVAGNLNLSIWAKQLVSTDTFATSSGTGQAQDGNSAVVTVLRGVLPSVTTLMFSSAATATSANPNSPTLAIGSTNAIVLSVAAQIANNTVTTLPSGYSSCANAGGTDTRSSHIAMSFVTGSEQSYEDPGQWVFSASAQWLAITVGAFDSGSIYYPIRSENVVNLATEARRVVVKSY
jgi:hypothetical protein